MARKQMYYEIGNGTDVGRVRSRNEDSYVCHTPRDRWQRKHKGHMLLVCDGMGGAVGGSTASSIAVETIAQVYYEHKHADPGEALVRSIEEANRRIYERSEAEPQLSGMGTTAVLAVLLEGRAFIAHVGDSRCYLVRDGGISQLTRDHTMVNKMVEDGLLTPAEARKHPDSHILNRSVGVAPSVEVELQATPLELRSGDCIVLCSDGLSGQVDDEEIRDIVLTSPPQEASERLITLAVNRGGPDNVTVQVAKVNTGVEPRMIATGATLTMPPLKPRRHLLRWLVVLLVIAALSLGGYFALWWYGIIDSPPLDTLLGARDRAASQGSESPPPSQDRSPEQ